MGSTGEIQPIPPTLVFYTHRAIFIASVQLPSPHCTCYSVIIAIPVVVLHLISLYVLGNMLFIV